MNFTVKALEGTIADLIKRESRKLEFGMGGFDEKSHLTHPIRGQSANIFLRISLSGEEGGAQIPM